MIPEAMESNSTDRERERETTATFFSINNCKALVQVNSNATVLNKILIASLKLS